MTVQRGKGQRGTACRLIPGCLPRARTAFSALKAHQPCTILSPSLPCPVPQWSNLWSDDLPFGACCLIMAVDALLYSLVAWYLGRVGHGRLALLVLHAWARCNVAGVGFASSHQVKKRSATANTVHGARMAHGVHLHPLLRCT